MSIRTLKLLADRERVERGCMSRWPIQLVKINGLEKLEVEIRSFNCVPNIIEYAQHLRVKLVNGGGQAGMEGIKTS